MSLCGPSGYPGRNIRHESPKWAVTLSSKPGNSGHPSYTAATPLPRPPHSRSPLNLAPLFNLRRVHVRYPTHQRRDTASSSAASARIGSPEPRTHESSMPNLRINNTRSAPAILRRLRLCGCVCRVGCDGGGGGGGGDGGAAEANVKRCVASCRREAVKRKPGGRGAARRWRRGDAMVAERR